MYFQWFRYDIILPKMINGCIFKTQNDTTWHVDKTTCILSQNSFLYLYIYMHCSKRINTLIVRNCENKNKHLHTAYAFLKNASLPLTALINISTSSWSKRFLKQKTYYITWSRTPVLLFAFFRLICLIFGCLFCFFVCLVVCLIV